MMSQPPPGPAPPGCDPRRDPRVRHARHAGALVAAASLPSERQCCGSPWPRRSADGDGRAKVLGAGSLAADDGRRSVTAQRSAGAGGVDGVSACRTPASRLLCGHTRYSPPLTSRRTGRASRATARGGAARGIRFRTNHPLVRRAAARARRPDPRAWRGAPPSRRLSCQGREAGAPARRRRWEVVGRVRGVLAATTVGESAHARLATPCAAATASGSAHGGSREAGETCLAAPTDCWTTRLGLGGLRVPNG